MSFLRANRLARGFGARLQLSGRDSSVISCHAVGGGGGGGSGGDRGGGGGGRSEEDEHSQIASKSHHCKRIPIIISRQE